MSFSDKVSSLLEQGVLVSPDLLDEYLSKEKVEDIKKERSVVLDKRKSKEEILDGQPRVKVLYSYDKKSKKRSFDDFVKFFNFRFKALERLIRQRPEMQGLISNY